MPAFGEEFKLNREINYHTTLSELRRILEHIPALVDEDWVSAVRLALQEADVELAKYNGVLSQKTAKKLDNLLRQFRLK